jgi:hypothetical protein
MNNNQKTHIDGLPGFGFPGERGDAGVNGIGTKFREITYEQIESTIPIYINDNRETTPLCYIKLKNTEDDILKQDDTVIVNGLEHLYMYRVKSSDEGLYIIYTEPINTFDITYVPEYSFDISYAILASNVNHIKLYPILSAKDLKKYKIVYTTNFEEKNTIKEYIIKEFEEETFKNTDNIYIGNNVFEKELYFFLYYKVNPYKFKKLYITKIEIRD